MLQRILQRFKAEVAWHRAHKQAFHDEAIRGADGSTVFQKRCLEAISAKYPELQFRPELNQDGTLMLVAKLSSSGEQVYIYENEAGIFGGKESTRLEEWSFAVPEELRTSLVGAIGTRHLEPAHQQTQGTGEA